MRCDLLRIRVDQPHEPETGQDDERDEEPGEGQGLQSERWRCRLRHADEEWPTQGSNQRAHEDIAETFRPPARGIQIGSCQPELLSRAHTEPKEDEAAKKPEEGVLHQRKPDGNGADQGQEESRQEPRASTVGIGDMAGWIGDEKPAPAEDAGGEAGERWGAEELCDHDRAEGWHHLVPHADKGLCGREQQRIALDHGWDGEWTRHPKERGRRHRLRCGWTWVVHERRLSSAANPLSPVRVHSVATTPVLASGGDAATRLGAPGSSGPPRLIRRFSTGSQRIARPAATRSALLRGRAASRRVDQ